MNIVVVSELGGGNGHLGIITPIILELKKQGHLVSVITKFISKDFDTIPSPPIPYRQRDVNTYLDFLDKFSWNSLSIKESILQEYYKCFSRIEPDLIIVEHSPYGNLAANNVGIPVVLIGTGYSIPPDYPLDSVKHIITSFMELDHYGPRDMFYSGNYEELYSTSETIIEDEFLYIPDPKKYGRKINSIYNNHIPKICVSHGLGTIVHFLLLGVPCKYFQLGRRDTLLLEKKIKEYSLDTIEGAKKFQEKYKHYNKQEAVKQIVLEIINAYPKNTISRTNNN